MDNGESQIENLQSEIPHPTIAEWHEQFVRQARWTQVIRNQLYRQANLMQAERILDVGCGTGVIANELARRTRGTVLGVDINAEMLALARRPTSRSRYETANALDLPYPDGHFDITTCHFTLMWVHDPALAVREMARVTRQGGHVLICAEPDYGGRLDWPDLPIREWQIEGLRRQGADPLIGRRVRQLLADVGLRCEVGTIPGNWDAHQVYEDAEAEWKWIAYDVGDAVDPATFEQVWAQARAALDAGTRLAYVPIFYAAGKK